MVTLITPTVTLREFESPASFVSRLAHRNGIKTARYFCVDMGLNFQQIVDGHIPCLRDLSELSGTDLPRLIDQSIVRVDKTYSFRDERMLRSTLNRSRIFVCPVCIANDLRDDHDIETVRAYGRTHWMFEPIRTCEVHDRSLVELASTDRPHFTHDFSYLTQNEIGRLDAVSALSVHRKMSAFERYLLNRAYSKNKTEPWLDGVAWHAVARTSEVMGVVKIFGRKRGLKDLSDDDLWRAGQAGFEYLQSGREGLIKFLSDVFEDFPFRRRSNGEAQEIFGTFWHWLSRGAPNTDFEPVRDVVFDFLLSRMAFGEGEKILGRVVERRRFHSVRSASIEWGMHPKRLRKVLVATGVINDDPALTDQRMLFDPVSVGEVIELEKTAVSLKELEVALNVRRPHPKLIVDAGLLVQLKWSKTDKLRDVCFARTDIDALMFRLAEGAEEFEVVPEGTCDVLAAARFSCAQTVTVLRLILDRKLQWTGKLSGTRGLPSIFVTLNEVQRLTRGKELDGLTMPHLQDRLNVSNSVAKRLIEHGILQKKSKNHPVTNQIVEVVTNDSIERFEHRFISLFNLSKSRQMHPLKMIKILNLHGVETAIDRDIIGARFYKKAMVELVH